MAATLIVKITRDDSPDGTEIRRFTTKAEELSFSRLTRRVAEAFGLAPAHFKVLYKDDEGDLVTISTDIETQEAVELALQNEPSILRLTIKATCGAAVPPPGMAPHAPLSGTPPPPPMAGAGATSNLTALLEDIAAKLPTMMASLPESVQRMIPNAELDVAATMAATAAANCATDVSAHAAAATNAAATAAAAAAAADGLEGSVEGGAAGDRGIHPNVTCDRTGMCPIVGPRYHLCGHNYDLCQAAYDQLEPNEQALYTKIPPPTSASAAGTGRCFVPAGTFGTAPPPHPGHHPGVKCDRSGVSPIIGFRYNLVGHDYDLCQAEFDKLPAIEKAAFKRIAPPPWTVRGFDGGWGCRPGRFGGRRGGHGGVHAGTEDKCGNPKLAARFVRDVSIFEGTQMAPGTPFTKIWRLKNIGEVPWPEGARMIFVGGDQMSADMSVPLSHTGPVMPGEEVDVAVEMIAPKELGRYLGNWRLTGPHMRRRFGQRVWCHIQVVDPSKPLTEAEVADIIAASTAASSAAAAAADGGEDDADADAAHPDADSAGASVKLDGKKVVDTLEAEAEAEHGAVAIAAAAAGEAEMAWPSSDDEYIVLSAAAAADDAQTPPPRTDEDTLLAAVAAAAAATTTGTGHEVNSCAPSVGSSAPSPMVVDATDVPALEAQKSNEVGPVAEAGAQLFQMGFTDAEMVTLVLEKHGPDLDACARDLSTFSDWGSLLADLQEMGFKDVEKNKRLVVKHNGSLKSTIRELVSGK